MNLPAASNCLQYSRSDALAPDSSLLIGTMIMSWTLGVWCRNEYNSPTRRKLTHKVTATHRRIKNFDRRDRYSTMEVLLVLSDSSVPTTGTSVQTPLRAGCFTDAITTPQRADSSAARLRKLSFRFSRRDCPLSAVSTLLTRHVPGGSLAAYSSTRSTEYDSTAQTMHSTVRSNNCYF